MARKKPTRLEVFQRWLVMRGLSLTVSLQMKTDGKFLWQVVTSPITEFAYGPGPQWQVAFGRGDTIDAAVDHLIRTLSEGTLCINADHLRAFTCPEFPEK